MEIGYLKVETFIGERLAPVIGVKVTVECAHGNVLHEVFTDENGQSEKIILPAKELGARYNITITHKRGFRTTIVRGVHIFPGIGSILPVKMLPDSRGDSEPHEIIIPDFRGVSLYERAYKGLSAAQIPRAKVNAPAHIAVYETKVPIKDYIKNIASSMNNPTLESAALGANILIQMSAVLGASSAESTPNFLPPFAEGREIFSNVAGIVDELWGLYFVSERESDSMPVCDERWQESARILAIRGFNPVQIVSYLCPGIKVFKFE